MITVEEILMKTNDAKEELAILADPTPINMDHILTTINPSNKFRAWDIELKKMYTRFEFVTSGSTSGGTLSDWIIWGETMAEMWDNYEKKAAYPSLRFILMQCTGFKDTNRTEIYNGDILLHPHDYSSYSKLIVKWDDMGHWSFYNPKTRSADTIYNIPCVDNYKIVGNIYETPELISA